jgi:hypothetical protein
MEIAREMDVESPRLCRHCAAVLKGPICHQCGQHHRTERWTTSLVAKLILQHLTNIERGFLGTTLALFKSPGRVIKDYWRGSTVSYYDPCRYLLLWVGLSLILNFLLGIDDILQEHLEPESVEASFGADRVEAADQVFDRLLNALTLILVPVNAFMGKLLFRGSDRNYAEFLILSAYCLAQQALLGCLPQGVLFVFPQLATAYLVVSFLMGVAYNTYVFRQVFAEAWWRVTLKALVISSIGTAVLMTLMITVSTVALRLQ